jgi:hypothetical protein
MNRIILLSILICFSVFSFGQNCPLIDSNLLIKKAKKTIIKTNKNLYEKPPELNIAWENYKIVCGKSIDCSNKNFDFYLVSFVDSEGHYANVIFEYKSKRKLMFLECHFTIDTPQQILDSIKKDPEYYWGCNV